MAPRLPHRRRGRGAGAKAGRRATSTKVRWVPVRTQCSGMGPSQAVTLSLPLPVSGACKPCVSSARDDVELDFSAPCEVSVEDELEICPVCLDDMSVSPAIQLSCGHSIHEGCAISMLESVDWQGQKIVLSALQCPSGCGNQLDHPCLQTRLVPLLAMSEKVKANVVVRAKEDGVTGSLEPMELLRKYQYFGCHRCEQPFFGGMAECQADAAEPDPDTLLCHCCEVESSGKECSKHGSEFMAIKCNFCCNEALFHCGGTDMYCGPCHDPPIGTVKPCDPSKCPLRGEHPQGMTHKWMMGCAACRADAANRLE